MTMNRPIDTDRAAELRANWLRMAAMWTAEAKKLRALAKAGPGKYHANRMTAATGAEYEARKYRLYIGELDEILNDND